MAFFCLPVAEIVPNACQYDAPHQCVGQYLFDEQAVTPGVREGIALQVERLVVGRNSRIANEHTNSKLSDENPV